MKISEEYLNEMGFPSHLSLIDIKDRYNKLESKITDLEGFTQRQIISRILAASYFVSEYGKAGSANLLEIHKDTLPEYFSGSVGIPLKYIEDKNTIIVRGIYENQQHDSDLFIELKIVE